MSGKLHLWGCQRFCEAASVSLTGVDIYDNSAGPPLAMSTRSATLCALWYLLATALSVSIQKFRMKLAREHGRWSCEGLGCSSCLSEMRLEFIMVQQAGGDVENCLEKVKRTEK